MHDKRAKLKNALLAMHERMSFMEFIDTVADRIIERDKQAKIAGIKYLVDPTSGHIFELDAFEVQEIINSIKQDN